MSAIKVGEDSVFILEATVRALRLHIKGKDCENIAQLSMHGKYYKPGLCFLEQKY